MGAKAKLVRFDATRGLGVVRRDGFSFTWSLELCEKWLFSVRDSCIMQGSSWGAGGGRAVAFSRRAGEVEIGIGPFVLLCCFRAPFAELVA